MEEANKRAFEEGRGAELKVEPGDFFKESSYTDANKKVFEEGRGNGLKVELVDLKKEKETNPKLDWLISSGKFKYIRRMILCQKLSRH